MNGSNPEDQLLDALAQLARDDEERFGDDLRRLTAGTLSADEEAALQARAEASEQARLDYEAFRPLGSEFHDRVERELNASKTSSRTPSSTPSTSSTLQPIRSRRTKYWLPLAASLLLVTATLWFLLPRLQRSPAVGSTLPSYSVEWRGGTSDSRSGPDPAQREPEFTAGMPFDLLLRPEDDASIDFDLYLRGADGEFRAAPEAQGPTRSGAVRVQGSVGEGALQVEPGRWELILVYGAEGSALPQPSRVRQQLESQLEQGEDDEHAWRILRVPFRVISEQGNSQLGVSKLSADPGAPPLEVRYAGCATLLPGPVCALRDTLTVWARTSARADLHVIAGERSFDTRSEVAEAFDGGWRFQLLLDDDTPPPQVEVVATEAGAQARFELRLGRDDRPAWLLEARRLHFQQPDAARAVLERHAADNETEFVGRVASLQARLADDRDQQRQLLQQAVERHLEEGRLMDLVPDLGMLAWLDNSERDLTRLPDRLELAERALSTLPQALIPAEVAVSLAYSRGVGLSDLGQFRGALEALRDGAELARRLDLDAWRRDLIEGQLALVLQRLGRRQEAAELVEAFAARGDAIHAPCQQAELLNLYAWTQLLDSNAVLDPLPLLQRASNLSEQQGDCASWLRLDLALNLALAHTRRDQVWQAHQALERAERFEDAANTLHHLWKLDIRGRLELVEQRAGRALETYRDMEALAHRAFDPQGLWWARVQQAAAHEALGEPERALAAYEGAESLLDQQSLQVPVAEGRESFTAAREVGARRHLDLLLRLGRLEAALDAARRSRSRVLRSLRQGHRLAQLDAEQRARWDLGVAAYLHQRAQSEAAAAEQWELSRRRLEVAQARYTDQQREALQALDRAFEALGEDRNQPALPSLQQGELTLVYHPLAGTSWVGLAAWHEASTGELRVESHTFERASDQWTVERASQDLLQPFARAIEANSRLRILAYGPLQAVDFHALPWREGVLLEHTPVVYGLDLPEGQHPTPLNTASTVRRHALVVGDPRGDLPAAALEAEQVARSLRSREEGEVEYLARQEATHAAIRPRLAELDLLHLAGHGTVAGPFGWDSALLLAADSRLSLGDILALPRAPRQVVLSSCDSASDRPSNHADSSGVAAGLGLAQAFVVAGSEIVVASLRPVGDRDTESLFRRVYRPDAKSSQRADLAERLRQAQLAWRRDDPSADWASFRVLTP